MALSEVVELLVTRTKEEKIQWSDYDVRSGWIGGGLMYNVQILPSFKIFIAQVDVIFNLRSEAERRRAEIKDAEEIAPLIELLLERFPPRLERVLPEGLTPATLDDDAQEILQLLLKRLNGDTS